jgi:hypothetical protein
VEQDRRNKTGGTRQAEQDRRNKTGGTRQSEQDSQKRAIRTEQTEHECNYRTKDITARTGLSEVLQDSRDRTVSTVPYCTAYCLYYVPLCLSPFVFVQYATIATVWIYLYTDFEAMNEK